MGISANQARLLALTARKCTLEENIQKLLNNKISISRETARIANTYNDAISNRKLFVFKPTASQDESIYNDLSAANLYAQGGYIVVEKRINGAGNASYIPIKTNDSQTIEEGLRNGIYCLVKPADLTTQDVKTINVNESYAGGNIFGGTNAIDKPPTNTKWAIVPWQNSTLIMDELDKSDDAIALSQYEKDMNDLKTKEATIDLEINETETSHTAISNEMESVKKVLTKNTEEAFKYLS